MEIELIVRAVIEDRGHFLIAHTNGASNTYLPGGHVEAGEGLKYALARELVEELGVESEIGMYLGTVEHVWEDGGGHSHEVNHLFEVTSPEFRNDHPPQSLEDHNEFLWLAPSKFDEHNLQPKPLRQLLADWEPGSQTAGFASTIEPGLE